MDTTTFVLVMLVAVQVGVMGSQVTALQKRAAVLSRIEDKLDLLLKNAGIGYDPFGDLPRPVVEALQEGKKIQAIKCYREATGAGLKEAKDFIEQVQARAKLPA